MISHNYMVIRKNWNREIIPSFHHSIDCQLKLKKNKKKLCSMPLSMTIYIVIDSMKIWET